MTTLGWLFILMAGLVIRQVVKGRVLETPQDISDTFLAIIGNDTAKLKEVLSRTGSFNMADKADEIDLGEGTFRRRVAGDTSQDKYHLGGVKDHVAYAANTIGPKFGIKTIGGVGPGSVPNSLHPRGLALDFMINNIENGKSVGQSLANYAVANADSYGIIEVIWNRRIWNKSKGWHAYVGPSEHTDHVHLSFGDN